MASSPNTPHVALLSFPFASHGNTLHFLGRLLASATPHALFSFFGSVSSNAPLAKIPSPKNLALYSVSDGCPEGFLSMPVVDPEEVVALFLKVSPGNYLGGMQQAVTDRGGVPISCVVCDCLLVPLVSEVAGELGVPWVAFRTGGTSALSSHVYTDEIRLGVGAGEQASVDQKLDFVPSLSAFRVADLPEGVVHGNLHSPFSQLLHRVGTQICHATAVALNTSHALEGPVVTDLATKFAKCLPLGPLNLLDIPRQPNPDMSGCLSWLDHQPPSSVVYVAFGTSFTLGEAEQTAVAEALEASGTRFLWSLKEKAQTQLPRGFIDRTAGKGMVLTWVPQVEVLGHVAVGVFVTHCGWKSVTESVGGGVPMICRPFFGDQRLNARQVTDVWGIGVWPEGGVLTKEGVVGALDKVLVSEEGRRMRERAVTIKELAKKAVGPDGNSTKCFKELVEIVCRA